MEEWKDGRLEVPASNLPFFHSFASLKDKLFHTKSVNLFWGEFETCPFVLGLFFPIMPRGGEAPAEPNGKVRQEPHLPQMGNLKPKSISHTR